MQDLPLEHPDAIYHERAGVRFSEWEQPRAKLITTYVLDKPSNYGKDFEMPLRLSKYPLIFFV